MLRIDLTPGESVTIGGNVVVTLEYKSGQRARLAFAAPREVKIQKGDNVSDVIRAARGGITRKAA
jgi:sRNA-binding carbon storage regulator CsrA